MKSSLITLFGAALAASIPMMASATGDVFYGLNYGIDQNNCPTLDKMKQDFALIQKYTNRVRTFSLHICNQGEDCFRVIYSI